MRKPVGLIWKEMIELHGQGREKWVMIYCLLMVLSAKMQVNSIDWSELHRTAWIQREKRESRRLVHRGYKWFHWFPIWWRDLCFRDSLVFGYPIFLLVLNRLRWSPFRFLLFLALMSPCLSDQSIFLPIYKYNIFLLWMCFKCDWNITCIHRTLGECCRRRRFIRNLQWGVVGIRRSRSCDGCQIQAVEGLISGISHWNSKRLFACRRKRLLRDEGAWVPWLWWFHHARIVG